MRVPSRVFFTLILASVACPTLARPAGAQSWTIETISDSAGPACAIATDRTGNPAVLYSRGGDPFSPRFARRITNLGPPTWFSEVTGVPLSSTFSFTLDDYAFGHASLPVGGGEPNLFYTHGPLGSWSGETVAPTGGTSHSSIKVKSSAFYPPPLVPLVAISYYVSIAGDLRLARKPGGAWMLQTVDSAGNVGAHNSLALFGPDGFARISYRDEDNKNLRYAETNGATWTIQVVDASANNVGAYSSLAVGPDGEPRIAYYDSTAGDLKFARRTGELWAIDVVDSAGDVGRSASLALSAQGNARIAYYDATNGDLKYARQTGNTWTTEVVAGAASDAGSVASLALDVYGKPHISFADVTAGEVRYAVAPPDTATFQDVFNGGIDQASVSTGPSTLTIGNIGSSGDDGVSLSSDPSSTYRASWQALGTPSTYPDGSFLQINPLYPGDLATPGESAIPTDPVRITDIGAALEITADFGTIGAATKTVEVYDGGALVARRTGLLGPALARIAEWPAATSLLIVADVASDTIATPRCDLHTMTVASVLIVDNAFAPLDTTVSGDEIRIIAESPTLLVPYLEGLDLRASQIPTIVVVAETSLAVTGVPGPRTNPSGARIGLLAVPNPTRDGRIEIRLSLPGPVSGAGARSSLALFDASGRQIRTLFDGPVASTSAVVWDGRDDRGRVLPAGVYLLRLETPRGSTDGRVTLIR
jgi:hypothetical protein